MPRCGTCAREFPLMGEGISICHLCKELESVSEVEKDAIQKTRAASQCISCGLVSSLIKIVCMLCIGKWANIIDEGGSIPACILGVAGAAALICPKATDQAELDDSQSKAKTATSRSRTVNSSLAKASLSRAEKIAEERRNKKNGSITLLGYLWETAALVVNQNSKKMTQVPNATFRVVTAPDNLLWNALSDLITLANGWYIDEFPRRQPLTKSILRWYSHEGPQSFTNLTSAVLGAQTTVYELLEYFNSHGMGTKTSRDAKIISLRMMYNLKDVDPDLDMQSAAMSTLPSIRRLKSSMPVSSLKSTTPASTLRSSVSVDNLRSVTPASSQKREAPMPDGPDGPQKVRRLESAWRPDVIKPSARKGRVLESAYRALQPAYARDPEMGYYSFRRIAAKEQDGDVTFTVDDQVHHTLSLSKDWEKGKADQSIRYMTGFLGVGSTKVATYARFGKKEYAVATHLPGSGSEDEVALLLEEELKLLLQGAMFKRAFDALASEEGVRLPRFEFNDDGAFLGRLELDGGPGEELPLPYRHFIATPLLPCSAADGPFQKVTGSYGFGEVEDGLKSAIHAFTHFTWLYTQKTMIMCDLQGIMNNSRTFMLVDAQAHSTRDAHETPYWDRGSKGIKQMIDDHLDKCEENWYCQRLDLLSLEYTAPGSGVRSPTCSPKQGSKARQTHDASPYETLPGDLARIIHQA